MIKHLPHLQTLQLNYTEILRDGACSLADALLCLIRLQSLDTEQNAILDAQPSLPPNVSSGVGGVGALADACGSLGTLVRVPPQVALW